MSYRGLFAPVLWLVLLHCATLVWSAPANDNFSDRQVLQGGRLAVSANNADATCEPGEPVSITGAEKTLWWSWTAPASGWVKLKVTAGFYNKIAFWQGDWDGLTCVTNLYFSPSNTFIIHPWLPWSPPSPGHFQVEAGQVYSISIGSLKDGNLWRGGPLFWTLDLCSLKIAVPENDSLLAPNPNLTAELTPPLPDVEGQLGLSTFVIVPTNTDAGLYYSILGGWVSNKRTAQTATPGSLTAVFSNLPPNDYFIYADVTNESGRLLTTPTIRFKTRPGNDDFASAKPIDALPFKDGYYFFRASEEPNEPQLTDQIYPASVWWRWTAPSNGIVRLQCGSVFGIFTGTTLSTLELKAEGQQELRFAAQAGITYYIKTAPQMTNYLGDLPSAWSFSLAWTPPNDDFANRKMLAGGSTEDTGNTTGATIEPEETQLDVSPARSVWWSWTAPAGGLASLQVTATNSMRAQVWQGNNFSDFEFVASAYFERAAFPPGTLFPPAYPPKPLRFEAQEGAVYQIAISGGEGPFTFTLDLCSLHVVAPEPEAVFDPITNVVVRLSVPRLDIEGQPQSVVIRAIATNPFIYFPGYSDHLFYEAKASTQEPITAVLTNLIPNEYLVFAEVTNAAGRLLVTTTNRFRIAPENDQFAAAKEITGWGIVDSYLLSGATAEPGEPLLPFQQHPASLWWRWTSPIDGVVILASVRQTIGAFTGERLDALTPVGTYVLGVLRLEAKAGATYFFKAAPSTSYLAGDLYLASSEIFW